MSEMHQTSGWLFVEVFYIQPVPRHPVCGDGKLVLVLGKCASKGSGP